MANTPAITSAARIVPQPPKSILKKPSAAASGTLQTAKPAKPRAPSKTTSRTPLTGKINVSQGRIGPNGRRLPSPEEAREIALNHAYIIQNQKNLELAILESVELLLDFPTSNNPASRPSDVDVDEFKKNLVHFRPTDFDDLIEERNIIHKCGYPLCPLPNKLQPTKAKFRILDKGRRIVEAKQLERFCGDECARRGLWIRVQLNDEPSWLRTGEDGQVGRGGLEYRITLLEEEKREPRESAIKGDVRKLVDQLQGMGISATGLPVSLSQRQVQETEDIDREDSTTGKLADQLQTIAISNGSEPEIAPQLPRGKELVTITERAPSSSKNAEPPKAAKVSFEDSAEDKLAAKMAAMAVEGYTPKGSNKDLASKWREAVAARENNDNDNSD